MSAQQQRTPCSAASQVALRFPTQTDTSASGGAWVGWLLLPERCRLPAASWAAPHHRPPLSAPTRQAVLPPAPGAPAVRAAARRLARPRRQVVLRRLPDSGAEPEAAQRRGRQPGRLAPLRPRLPEAHAGVCSGGGRAGRLDHGPPLLLLPRRQVRLRGVLGGRGGTWARLLAVRPVAPRLCMPAAACCACSCAQSRTPVHPACRRKLFDMLRLTFRGRRAPVGWCAPAAACNSPPCPQLSAAAWLLQPQH